MKESETRRTPSTEPNGGRQARSLRGRELSYTGNLLITLAVTVPLFLLPLGVMIAYSFARQDYVTGVISFGWTTEAWKALNDSILIRSAVRSVGLATLATLGCALLGYPLAYFVARHAGRFRTAALLLVILPFWVSFIVRAYAWLDLLGPHGPVNRAVIDLGLRADPLPLVYNNLGIAIGITYGYLPLMVFPIYVALERIEPTILEAARDLGASATSAFFKITFPQALPGLIAGCILVWVPALGEYVIPAVLGGGKTFMFGNLIALRFQQLNWPVGAAMSVGMMAFALVCLGLFLRVIGRERLTAGARTVAEA